MMTAQFLLKRRAAWYSNSPEKIFKQHGLTEEENNIISDTTSLCNKDYFASSCLKYSITMFTFEND